MELDRAHLSFGPRTNNRHIRKHANLDTADDHEAVLSRAGNRDDIRISEIRRDWEERLNCAGTRPQALCFEGLTSRLAGAVSQPCCGALQPVRVSRGIAYESPQDRSRFVITNRLVDL